MLSSDLAPPPWLDPAPLLVLSDTALPEEAAEEASPRRSARRAGEEELAQEWASCSCTAFCITPTPLVRYVDEIVINRTDDVDTEGVHETEARHRATRSADIRS